MKRLTTIPAFIDIKFPVQDPEIITRAEVIQALDALSSVSTIMPPADDAWMKTIGGSDNNLIVQSIFEEGRKIRAADSRREKW